MIAHWISKGNILSGKEGSSGISKRLWDPCTDIIKKLWTSTEIIEKVNDATKGNRSLHSGKHQHLARNSSEPGAELSGVAITKGKVFGKLKGLKV